MPDQFKEIAAGYAAALTEARQAEAAEQERLAGEAAAARLSGDELQQKLREIVVPALARFEKEIDAVTKHRFRNTVQENKGLISEIIFSLAPVKNAHMRRNVHLQVNKQRLFVKVGSAALEDAKKGTLSIEEQLGAGGITEEWIEALIGRHAEGASKK